MQTTSSAIASTVTRNPAAERLAADPRRASRGASRRISRSVARRCRVEPLISSVDAAFRSARVCLQTVVRLRRTEGSNPPSALSSGPTRSDSSGRRVA